MASQTPHSAYEPSEIAFISNIAVISLSALIQERLVESDQAKTAFVSMISHELRTPLHGMLSQLELIKEYAKPENLVDIGDLLDTAEVCGLMLRDVLNDVLDFGKMEMGAASSASASAMSSIPDPSSSSGTTNLSNTLSPDVDIAAGTDIRRSPSTDSERSPKKDHQLSQVNLATLARDILQGMSLFNATTQHF